MRFIVFFDLFATLVMPATLGYLVYLLYAVLIENLFFPTVVRPLKLNYNNHT